MALWINVETHPGTRATVNFDNVLWFEPLENGGGYNTELHFVGGGKLAIAEKYPAITMHIDANIAGANA